MIYQSSFLWGIKMGSASILLLNLYYFLWQNEKFQAFCYREGKWFFITKEGDEILSRDLSIAYDVGVFFVMTCFLYSKKEKRIIFYDAISKEDKRFIWLHLKRKNEK